MRVLISFLLATVAVLLGLDATAEEPRADLAALTKACTDGDKAACARAERAHLALAEELRAGVARLVRDEEGMARVGEVVVSEEEAAKELRLTGFTRRDECAATKPIDGPGGMGELREQQREAVGKKKSVPQFKVFFRVETKDKPGAKELEKQLRRRSGQFKKCAERVFRARLKMVSGKVGLRLQFAANGRVKSIKGLKNTTGNKELKQCLLSNASRIRLRESEEIRTFDVSLIFKSKYRATR